MKLSFIKVAALSNYIVYQNCLDNYQLTSTTLAICFLKENSVLTYWAIIDIVVTQALPVGLFATTPSLLIKTIGPDCAMHMYNGHRKKYFSC